MMNVKFKRITTLSYLYFNQKENNAVSYFRHAVENATRLRRRHIQKHKQIASTATLPSCILASPTIKLVYKC